MSDTYLEDEKLPLGMESAEWGGSLCVHSLDYQHKAHCGKTYTWIDFQYDEEGKSIEVEKVCDACHCLICNPIEGV